METAVLEHRFARNGNQADLDEAIEVGRRALDMAPLDHPDLVGYLSNLGNALWHRSMQSTASEGLEEAISYWQRAAKLPAGDPNLRLAAAARWGSAAIGAGWTQLAADGYAVAVGLLHEAAWHGLDRATREEQLARWSGLAAEAAAAAVLDGHPERAIELLEQGRSVIWAQALNLRGDLARLAEKDPHLAERLDGIRKILDSPMPISATAALDADPTSSSALSGGRSREQQDAADLRRRKAREWDQTIAEVRALDGFGHFLTAIPYADLADAAVDGPVVVLNASHHGCHALIMEETSGRLHVADLSSLSLDLIVNQVNKLLTALATAQAPMRSSQNLDKARRDVLEVLEWLWDEVTDPVLEKLGHTSTPVTGGQWPRVWWCPTGPFSFLPIHAAGHHSAPAVIRAASADCVLDRVISSYTPTLTALKRARESRTYGPVRHLGVGMPATAGMPPLSAVPAEMDVLARYFPPSERNLQLVESQAVRADVLSAAADHSWVHLACHAKQEQANPDSSGFILWDGALTIAELSVLPTQGRDLAFLSACQTATGSTRYPDEAIHLASAMQFLGYQHVVATMWTITDAAAPEVAEAVYAVITQSGVPNPRLTVQGLHRGVRALRDGAPNNPLLWAPYIHLGP
jgi:tetratricopeptide (TPR) repeat protein